MAEDIRLGVQISATDAASAKVKDLERAIASAQKQLAAFASTSTAGSRAAAAAVQQQISAWEHSVAALRAEGAAAVEARAAVTALTTAKSAATAANVTYATSTQAATASTRLFTQEARHVVAAFDGLARGQRGQVMASLGAAMRDTGVGATGLVAGVGGFVAFMTGAAILRGAESMGKWAEETKAAAEAAGDERKPIFATSRRLDANGHESE